MSELRYLLTMICILLIIPCMIIAYFYTFDTDYLILAFCGFMYGDIIDIRYKK